MTLDELALKYGTDKSSAIHNYTKLYEQYFELVREQPLRVLEIGIQEGASLRMWQEYFPRAEIIGMDIVDCQHMADERISIVKANQSYKKNLLEMAGLTGPYDIIIDDGSHINKDLLLTFDTLFPFLNPGGIYVAEDLHTCYWGRAFGRPKFIKRLKDLVDSVNAGGKSGIADRSKSSETSMRGMKAMTWWEKSIEFVHFYRSIVFIKRYD